MSWILFKNALCKAWLWLKEHWQIPLLVLWTVLVYIFARRNTDALLEVIEAKKISYRDQLEALRESHNKEILERDKLTRKYEITLKRVEEEFEKKEKELSKSQKNEIKEMIIKSKGNPDEVKEKIEKEFGIKFVE